MIVALGLSPAWQQIIVLGDSLRIGDVNRARAVEWCASGKVVNVARCLAEFSDDVHAVIPIGGTSGDSLRREFESHPEVGPDLATWVDVGASTRVCSTLLEIGGTRSEDVRVTEFVENAPPVSHEELVAYTDAARPLISRATAVVVTGSLPSGVPSTFVRDLLQGYVGDLFLDIRGAELLECLPLRPRVIKPNRAELEDTIGRPCRDAHELVAAMQGLHSAGAEWVIVTQGHLPSWVVGPNTALRVECPDVRVANSIGCGDCLAAGLAWSWADLGPHDAIRWGHAAASVNAERLRPADVTVASVRERFDRIRVVDP